MRFYYNGQLVRTSKTHHYTHAILLDDGKAATCSTTRKGCEDWIARLVNESRRGIENAEAAIKALTA